MKIEKTEISGVFVITPEIKKDGRGFFMELYRADVFNKYGISAPFVQENQSRSKKGVIRGLHFQWDPPLAKLILVTRGCAFMVVCDIRKNSETMGKCLSFEIDDKNKQENEEKNTPPQE